MKKIIHGKKYDTETAEEIASAQHGYPRDFGYYEETLYRKRGGEYFLYGYGHADSKYASRVMGDFAPGDAIMPLSYDQARDWAEASLEVDEYEAIFGEVSEEDDNLVTVTVRIPESVREKLRRLSTETGETQGAIIERLVSEAAKG